MAEVFFNRVKRTNEGVKYYFVSHLRRDFVERSVVLLVDERGYMKSLFFTSHRYGSAEWLNGEGLVSCHAWESGDDAQSATYLTRRYTVRLSDGVVDTNYAVKNIIADVLGGMADREFAAFLLRALKRGHHKRKLILDTQFFRTPSGK